MSDKYAMKKQENIIPNKDENFFPKNEEEYEQIYTAFIANNECKKILESYSFQDWDIRRATHISKDDNEPAFFITTNRFKKVMVWWWRNQEFHKHNAIFWLNIIKGSIQRTARMLKKQDMENQSKDKPTTKYPENNTEIPPDELHPSTQDQTTEDQLLDPKDPASSNAWRFHSQVTKINYIPFTDQEVDAMKNELITLLSEQEELSTEASSSSKRFKDSLAGIRAKIQNVRETIKTNKKAEVVTLKKFRNSSLQSWQLRDDQNNIIDSFQWTEQEKQELNQTEIPF